MSVRTLRVGDRALLVELAGGAETEAFHAELLRRRAAGALPGVREIVPAARTVLLDGVDDPGRLAAELPRWEFGPVHARVEAVVEVPVRYDGPDLAEVAALWGVSVEEAVRLHTATGFRVAFCGFAPGFGYLTGLDERYDLGAGREAARVHQGVGDALVAATHLRRGALAPEAGGRAGARAGGAGTAQRVHGAADAQPA